MKFFKKKKRWHKVKRSKAAQWERYYVQILIMLLRFELALSRIK